MDACDAGIGKIIRSVGGKLAEVIIMAQAGSDHNGIYIGLAGSWTSDDDDDDDDANEAAWMPGVSGDCGSDGVTGSGNSNLTTICSTSNHLTTHTQQTDK